MTAATNSTTNTAKFDSTDYDKYYKRACEVCVPIKLKVPVYIEPVVIEQKPECVNHNYN